MSQKILSFDLGTKTGWAYVDNLSEGWDIKSGHFSCDNYIHWRNEVEQLLLNHSPDIIVCSQTNSFGHYNSSRKMFMLLGIACLSAEKFSMPLVEFNDSSARKAVFGNGKLKKVEAQELLVKRFPLFKENTEDQNDAIILAVGWDILNRE